MNKGTTYILEFTEQGLAVTRPGKQAVIEEKEEPVASDVQVPRWDHWKQRKLARVWQATLLGMNIEPTLKARRALRKFEPARYAIYQDRLDILKTLIGVEIEFYEDHLREGDLIGEKYISLAEYYDFAKKNNWQGLDEMRQGLTMDKDPPVLRKNKENNYLELLHGIFLAHVPNYGSKTASETATAIMRWLDENNVHCPVSHQRLCDWVREMQTVASERQEKRKQEEERRDL